MVIENHIPDTPHVYCQHAEAIHVSLGISQELASVCRWIQDLIQGCVPDVCERLAFQHGSMTSIGRRYIV